MEHQRISASVLEFASRTLRPFLLGVYGLAILNAIPISAMAAETPVASSATSPMAAHLAPRELDREKTVTTEQVQLGQELPRTLVVRFRDGSRRAEVFHSSHVLYPNEASLGLVSTSSFVRLNSKGRMVRELDRDSSSSSWWYFGFPGYYYRAAYYPTYYFPSTFYPSYYYPTYNYFGFNYVYRPYFWSSFGGYTYAYYGWPYTNAYCW